jgi:lanosterol synthase
MSSGSNGPAASRGEAADPAAACERGIAYLRSLQRSDGSFEGEVVWCPMILAQYVILRTVLERPLTESERAGMILHFRRTKRQPAGWGLHPESPPYVFVTSLSYVALRLLGMPATDPLAAEARAWLQAQPSGVKAIPSWGKFWLAMVGLYDYRGMNPCPPELFLLPAWFPVNPDHLYCHTRYIYLAISYLYGARFSRGLGPLTAALRDELYGERWDAIDFASHRHDVSPGDLYVAPSRPLRLAWDLMAAYERLQRRLRPLQALRRRALRHCRSRIVFEQRASNFQGLSPVNGILNTLALSADDGDGDLLEASLAGVDSWRWDDATDGIRFAGARSTSWDSAFALQAMNAGPAGDAASLHQAHAFLRQAQETGELAGREAEARDGIAGGWCFSDGRHRWPVSDCAAEALTAILEAEAAGVVAEGDRLEPQRLDAAIAFILARQNQDGGFGTYERRRGPGFLERLNPSEMFGQCMTELSYIECTASAVIALCRVRDLRPDRLSERASRAIDEGAALLRRRQQADGAWPGFWGINFTYATWLAISALRAAGATQDDPALTRAAAWLVARQKPDGGWGEHYSSCLDGRYVEHPESQVVMTSWALLGLLETLGADAAPVARGIEWLCRRQLADGSWPEGAVNGVFFGSAMLTYRLYPAYFPVWVLNRYRRLVGHVGHR